MSAPRTYVRMSVHTYRTYVRTYNRTRSPILPLLLHLDATACSLHHGTGTSQRGQKAGTSFELSKLGLVRAAPEFEGRCSPLGPLLSPQWLERASCLAATHRASAHLLLSEGAGRRMLTPVMLGAKALWETKNKKTRKKKSTSSKKKVISNPER